MRRLYAGSVSYDATEEDIKEMFKPFGNITCLTISWDEEKNHHKVNTFWVQILQLTQGFAFIEYDCAEAASLALQHLKGASINGRRIKLGRPQAALRYQYIFAQIEMEGRAMAQGLDSIHAYFVFTASIQRLSFSPQKSTWQISPRWPIQIRYWSCGFWSANFCVFLFLVWNWLKLFV